MGMKENQIDRILADLVAGEDISAEDRQILESWKEASGGTSRFGREIQEIASSGAKLHGRRKSACVFEQVEQIVRKQRRVWFARHFSVAAGIALCLGLTAYFMLVPGRQTNEPVQVAATSIIPGGARAELVLLRGEVVRLDTAAKVVLAADSVTPRVISDGNTLIYDAGEKGAQVEYHTIRVPRGGEYNLQLADGTKVYLNAGSSLRYPVRFTGKRREVTLSGEGYFEVAKDSTQLFVVRAGDVDVRVLGTAFNVNAYPEKETVATTLVEGRVQVNYKTGQQVIQPGMQLVYDKQNGKVDVSVVDTEVYTSWKDGYYYFKREALENIMDVLVRWYDLTVFYQNQDLKRLEFGGRLKRYDDINYLLKKMEETRDVEFVIKGNTITVKRKTD